MSIYATILTFEEDADHGHDCARLTIAPEGEHWDICMFGGDCDRYYKYDPDAPCTCSALRGPYKYIASNQSITGPDHERLDGLFVCGAVGTNTIRLSLPDGVDTVLLDGRQVRELRDALDRYCKHADNPAEYGRENAYDAAAEPLDTEDD